MRMTPIGRLWLLAVMAGGVGAAEPAPASGDPLHSAECQSALQALQTAESTAESVPPTARPNEAPSSRTPAPNLVAARRQAATTCLAGRADSLPQAQRFAQPPFVVAPVARAASPRPAIPLSSPSPAPMQPNAPAAPTSILSCDIVGCWANDGSRLNRVGPNLWGSRGACTVQGTLLHCP
ncbi:MAG: hypothetical protein ABIN08_18150 [Caldimonas sp.]